MENLVNRQNISFSYIRQYHWHVKLFGFDKDTELYKDMEQYKKKSGSVILSFVDCNDEGSHSIGASIL